MSYPLVCCMHSMNFPDEFLGLLHNRCEEKQNTIKIIKVNKLFIYMFKTKGMNCCHSQHKFFFILTEQLQLLVWI